MKNLIFILLLSLSANSFLNAQVVTGEYSSTNTEEGIVKLVNNEVEILKNFTATKDQKKVINKIKKYVSPKVLGRAANTSAMNGKSVLLQMGFSAQGDIEYIVVVEGIGPKIDEKVVNLVREYDAKKPIAQTDMAKPGVIQLDIPLTSNKYYGG